MTEKKIFGSVPSEDRANVIIVYNQDGSIGLIKDLYAAPKPLGRARV